MKQYIAVITVLLSFAFLSTSCNDDVQKKQEEKTAQLLKHNDSVFKFLVKNWDFTTPRPTKELGTVIDKWSTWSDLKKELNLKPVSTIQAFQKKSEVLSSNALNMMYQSYPEEVSFPAVKARFTTLLNSLQLLEMYITLDPIDINLVDAHIKDVKKNIRVFYAIMEEELVRNKIPKEEGEIEMISEMNERALDATRNANPESE